MSEEKKLTDEEIIKALECCSKSWDCNNCKCDKENNNRFICSENLMKDCLDLIHRLQSENKTLKAELCKECEEHEEFTKKAKAEIERLTEEKSKEVNDLVKEKVKEIFKRIAKRKHQGFDVGGFFVEYTLRLEDLTWIEAYCGVEVE